MADNRPIGVMDSGFGGMSTLKTLRETLPRESFVFWGDNAHAPYGVHTAHVCGGEHKRRTAHGHCNDGCMHDDAGGVSLHVCERVLRLLIKSDSFPLEIRAK